MAVLEPAPGQTETPGKIRTQGQTNNARRRKPAVATPAVSSVARIAAVGPLPADDLTNDPAALPQPHNPLAHNPLVMAPELSLPLEAVTETFAILAKRGVGKTYTAAVLVEEMLKAGQTVVVADPVGVWWGLRSSPDGRGPGLPIAILGGDHGDAPLPAEAGAAVADLAAEERLSLVLDLSHFTPPEQTRFMTGFAERLYRRNRLPLHLVLDEADQFVPQVPEAGQQPLLWAMNRIVRLGRARGLGVTLISQRPAVLSKNVLTQAEVLIALRLTSPQDRKAVEAWVSAHDAPALRQEMLASLASLPVGTCWLWSPGWLDRLVRAQIRRRETFDSSATPKVGISKVAAGAGTGKGSPVWAALAPVDLDRLRARLASVEGQAAGGEEPPELQRSLQAAQERIAALEKLTAPEEQAATVQAAVKPVTKPVVKPVIQRVEVPVVHRVEVPALEAGQAGQLQGVARELAAKADALRADADRMENVAHEILLRLDRVAAVPGALPPPQVPADNQFDDKPDNRADAKPDAAGGRRVEAEPARCELANDEDAEGGLDKDRAGAQNEGHEVENSSNGDNGKMPLAERKILTALARHPEGLHKSQVAILTGYAVSGGGFNNALSALRSRGRLTGRDVLKIADPGRAALGDGEPLPAPGPALVQAWGARLGKAERLIVQALAQAHPGGLTKEQLGAATGYEPAGGGFNNALSRVRTLALVEGRGELRASDTLCIP